MPERVAKLKAEADELRAMLGDGKLSAIALQAAIDANERERAELDSAGLRAPVLSRPRRP